jgi:hypothetical protein
MEQSLRSRPEKTVAVVVPVAQPPSLGCTQVAVPVVAVAVVASWAAELGVAAVVELVVDLEGRY